jgi:23S rRNA (uracil1939-C5)-methyltransferase
MAVGLSRHRGPMVGYFRRGTREIVDAPDCRVLVPELLETTRLLRRFLVDTPRVPRELRHVDVRCGTDPGRQHATLVFRTTEMPRLRWDQLRKACPAVSGISVNLNPTSGPQVLKGRIEPVWGEREVWVETAGLELRVSPGAFFQVNLGLLSEIHRLMGEFLQGGKVLADLYAGVGTHGLALRGAFKRVVCIEGTRSAVADLRATVGKHDIKGVEVLAAPVEKGLRRLQAERPEAVVLNPSRAGALPAVLEGIAPTRRVAYLSCEPETLCRDLALLKGHGFEVVSVQPVDMMPQTQQVEALALLRRR